MTYRSPLLDELPVVPDDVDVPPPDEESGRGWHPRDYSAEPYGSLPFAAPFNMQLIDQAEWNDRIEFLEQSKSSVHDLCEAKGYKRKNQGRTSSCWAQSATMGGEIIEIIQGLEYLELSSGSVAALINNFNDRGGWPVRAIEFAAKRGWATAKRWPNNAVGSDGRQYDTPEADAERAHHQVREWWDLEPGNKQQAATLLLTGTPVIWGANWMSHAVAAVALLANGTKTPDVLCYNSGLYRDATGLTRFSWKQFTLDDGVAPRVLTGG